MRKIVVVAIVVIIIIAAGAALFYTTFQNPQLEKVTIDSIENFTSTGFTLKYSITIYNPNIIGVNITNLQYTLLLKDLNLVISNGTSPGTYVPARGSAEFHFDSQAYYSSAVGIVRDAIINKSVPIEINGVVTANLAFFTADVPFSRTVDIYPYISNAAQSIL